VRASLLVAAALSMLVLFVLVIGRDGDLGDSVPLESELTMSTRAATASDPPPAAHKIKAGLAPSRAPSQKAAPGKLEPCLAPRLSLAQIAPPGSG
jgi:hypothetical protein